MLKNNSTFDATKSHLGNVKRQNPDRVSQVNEVPKSLTAFIPSNLDLDKLLQENPPNFKYHIDNFKHLLDYVYKLFNPENSDIFSRFHSALIQRRIRNYREHFDYLISNEILFEDSQYIVGKKSRGFAYTSQYSVEAKQTIITHQRLIKKILKFYEVDFSKPIIDDTELDISYLTKWLSDRKLKIDFVTAKQYLLDLYIKESSLNDDSFDYWNYHAMQRFNSRLRPLVLFHKGNFSPKLDTTAGRLHSVLTQLKSDLRQFITYDNQPLVSIDIVNSQPYLASVLLNYEKYEKNNILHLIQLYNPNLLSSTQNPIMLAKLIQKVENAENVIKFINSVKTGRFYEEFGKLIGIDASIDNNRRIVKDATFSALFSPNEKAKHIKEVQLFKSTYPEVYEVFRTVKSAKGKHRALSCMLQRLEANLILHTICKNINQINPDIPMFTLHDSIITVPEYQDVIEQEMKQVLENAVGFAPELKVEKWERVA